MSYFNRDINICHVHNLGKDFEDDGFDPHMLKNGVVHRVANPDKLARVHAHNRSMRQEQSQHWPPYQEGRVWCACLGGNHVTLQLNCGMHNRAEGFTAYLQVCVRADLPVLRSS